MMKFVSKALRAVFPGKKKKPKKRTKDAGPAPAKDPIDETEAAIAEAIAAAKRLADAAGLPPDTKSRQKAPAMTEQRARLIEEALAVQRSKSHVFDNLSPEAREKLTVMALKALAPDVLERMREPGGGKRQAAAWPKNRKPR